LATLRLLPTATEMTNEKETQIIERADVEATPHGAGYGNTNAKDVAIVMVGEERHDIDPIIVARAIRKTDWFLIPAMIFGCAIPHPLLLSTLPTHHE
jgi:hypothetical protein